MHQKIQRFKLFVLFLLATSSPGFSQQLEIINSDYVQGSGVVDRNVVTFELSDFIQYYGGSTQNYSFFWHFGDGTYKIVEADGSKQTMVHTYDMGDNASRVYDDIYVAITKIYSEDDPPIRRTYFGGIDEEGNTGALTLSCAERECENPIASEPESPISIETNRDIVPGFEVTFIVSFNVTCEGNKLDGFVYFDYNPNEFTIDAVSYDDIYTTEQISTNKFRLKWDLDAMGLFFGNIFVTATASEDLIEGQEVDIESGIIDGVFCESETLELDSTEVVLSHDPNGLTSPSDYLCMGDFGTFVQYEINFENFGDGPAKTVIIKDIIPEIFDASTITTLFPLSQSNSVPPHTVNGKEVIWTLTDDWLSHEDGLLRGTGEDGYRVDFSEERTKGKLIFTIKYNGGFTPSMCEAIVNQAEIIFDCNPPFYTNPHFLDFSCTDYVLCPSCERNLHMEKVLPIVVQPGDAIHTGQIIANLPLGLKNKLENHYQSFRWYPDTLVSDDEILAPKIKAGKTMDYYLTAYEYSPIANPQSTTTTLSPSPCRKEIIKFPVQIGCDLGIDATVSCLTNGGVKIEATATGTYIDESALIWQNCSTGSQFMEKFKDGLQQDSFLITLTDRLTNCSVYHKVAIDCNNPTNSPSIGGWIAGVGASIVAILAGLFLRRKR